MRISGLFFALFRFLIPPALIVTVCLYLYAPLFDCSFPEARAAEAGCMIPGQQRDAVPAQTAPFRLLTLADPQLEGDTSLPDSNAPTFPSLVWLGQRLRDGDWAAFTSTMGSATREVVGNDVPRILYGFRKRIDLWGNDLYLRHIYRSVYWWSQPTHTVVLGDLVGSQWIGDEEFERRSDRFWKKVFKGTEKVPRSITQSSGRIEVLGEDERWRRRVIAVAGNHDIGYPGDIDEHRVERFEQTYGSVNWDIRFRLENGTSEPVTPFGRGGHLATSHPELHLVILNTMNLDSPAKTAHLQQQSREFAEAQLHQAARRKDAKSATVLLTHIPFHKKAGVCVDAPFFDYFPPDQGGGIKEQNHLTKNSSHYLLGGLAGSSGQGKAIVLNGHDHEGCDTYHYLHSESEQASWEAKPYHFARSDMADERLPGVREITVRSMMGSFSGNAGFLSGWFDYDDGKWKFEYNTCRLGVQHIWWAVHIFDLVEIGLGMAGLITLIWEESRTGARTRSQQERKIKKA